MTQVFEDDGQVTPVTSVKTSPGVVVFVKNRERDGYEALQLGFKEAKKKNKSKAELGHMGELGVFQVLKECRIRGKEDEIPKIGDKFDISQFSIGDEVKISSVSKGKGFQGVVKRHGFAGGPRSHGQKHSEREPGSIGATGPQRVLKGTKMAGRMGGDNFTFKGLKVVKIDSEKGVIFLKGSIPGRRGTLVEISG